MIILLKGFRNITPFGGAHVFSGRQRNNIAGRNQAMDFNCSIETTSASTARLSVSDTIRYPTQPADSVVTGTAWVTGVRQSDGECSSFKIDFTSQRIGTADPVLKANVTTVLYDGLALPTDPTMSTTTTGIYRVQVVGLAATNIAWDARIVAQQIVYTP